MARNYVNTAPPIALTAGVNATATILSVASSAGYPEAPFLIGIERGTEHEEVVLCTSKSATAFTVQRGFDGTTGKAHLIGASIEHTVAAIDYRETFEHIESRGGHGVGTIVGTTEAQTLTGKAISGKNNTLTDIPAGGIVGEIPSGSVPDVPWVKVVNKPSTFPPTAHTHSISQITGSITADNARKIDGRKIFVQSTAPTVGVSNGDIWFQA